MNLQFMGPHPLMGVATIEGRRYGFAASQGTGLIVIEGESVIVTFNCPMKSRPPQGTGMIIDGDGAELKIVGKELTFNGRPVYIGHPLE